MTRAVHLIGLKAQMEVNDMFFLNIISNLKTYLNITIPRAIEFNSSNTNTITMLKSLEKP
jgi:hypothetical protein